MTTMYRDYVDAMRAFFKAAPPSQEKEEALTFFKQEHHICKVKDCFDLKTISSENCYAHK